MSMLKAKQIKLAQGELVVGTSGGNGKVLAVGPANQFLSVVGSDVGYSYVSSLRDTSNGNAVLSVASGQVTLPTGYVPGSGDSLTTKGYVDTQIENAAQGLTVKESVRAAAATPVTLSNNQTVDGISLVAGNRVLVMGQGGDTATPHIDNGIYVVVADGPWTRSADFDGSPTNEVMANAYTFVTEGTLLGGSGWVLATTDAITVGTTPLAFTQFSTAGNFTAGVGLTRSGLDFSVNTTGVTTAIVSDNIVVASTATAGQILRSTGSAGAEAAWGALDLANTNAVTGLLPIANGGLGTDVTAFADGSLLIANGTGVVELASGAANTVLMGGTTPVYGYVQSLRNGAGLETLKIDTSGGTDNVLTVMTGGDVALVATGTATDIDLVLEPKGTGHVIAPSGYDLSTAPDEAFVTKGYVETVTITETGDDDLAYSGATVSTGLTTLTDFFANAPLANTVAVFFNGLKLPKDVISSITGRNLILDVDLVGYPLEAGDVISASYEYK